MIAGLSTQESPATSSSVGSVRLRKLEQADLPWLYKWENDATAWPDGATHNPLSKDDLRDYLQRTTGDIYLDGQLRLIICSGQGDAPTGCVDLYDVDIRNRKAGVAVYVDSKCRNQGLAREALKLLKSYASHILHFRMLYAMVRKENIASLKAFQTADFHIVACLPEWVVEGDICVLQTIL